jgi:hypothetical protein
MKRFNSDACRAVPAFKYLYFLGFESRTFVRGEDAHAAASQVAAS